MSRNDAILTVFAAILVVFSLVVALVLPRRNPGFPGRNLRVFALVAVLLVAAMLTAVEVFGEAHHFEEAEDGAEATETGAKTAPTETGGGDGDGGAGDPAAGQEVFASAGCGSCHVFEPAGSSGTVGPSLDESDVGFEAAVEQIKAGGGGMPPFEGQLSEQQILDVAAFVTQSGG